MIALTYDDIQLIPGYSEIQSRQNIRLQTKVTKRYSIMQPFIAAPMDTVCDSEMAIAMMKLGGLGIIHRFMTIEDQVTEVLKVKAARTQEMYENWGVMYDDWHADLKQIPIAAAVGANGDFFERAKELINAGADIILIDVAHGHHKNIKGAIQLIKSINPFVDVIAGNIATSQAALDLEDWGADGLRVGVGGGSVCTTRIQTGFGVPNVTCLLDVCSATNLPVIADGGIRTSGDAAKALALGANTVMIGSIISGTKETPGDILIGSNTNGRVKMYRGAASLETKRVHGQPERNVEGVNMTVPFKGEVEPIISNLLDGIRSALSYCGAKDLNHYAPNWIQITSAGQAEAKPHLINK